VCVGGLGWDWVCFLGRTATRTRRADAPVFLTMGGFLLFLFFFSFLFLGNWRKAKLLGCCCSFSFLCGWVIYYISRVVLGSLALWPWWFAKNECGSAGFTCLLCLGLVTCLGDFLSFVLSLRVLNWWTNYCTTTATTIPRGEKNKKETRPDQPPLVSRRVLLAGHWALGLGTGHWALAGHGAPGGKEKKKSKI
jgi:hypothetical protein